MFKSPLSAILIPMELIVAPLPLPPKCLSTEMPGQCNIEEERGSICLGKQQLPSFRLEKNIVLLLQRQESHSLCTSHGSCPNEPQLKVNVLGRLPSSLMHGHGHQALEPAC